MREPDARDAAWVLALALAGVLVAGLLVQVQVAGPVALGVLQGAFLGAPLVVSRAARLDPRSASGLVRLGWKQGVLVLLASLGSLWLLFELARGETELFRLAGLQKQAEAEEELIRRSVEMGRAHPLRSFLMFTVVPPICEEMFFRGILFRGIRSRFGPGLALLATTILFSSVHPTIGQQGMMLILGCYFGVLVQLTGSLWASILAHAVNNAAVVVMTWSFGGELKHLPAPWWILVISALLFGLAMTGLVLERRARPLAP